MHRVRSYLNGVVAEIRWAKRLSEWNHVPHFPYFVTHYVDSMPIASIGGILCDVLFNPKYAGCVYKVTVAIDSLGNIVWIGGAVWVTQFQGRVQWVCLGALRGEHSLKVARTERAVQGFPHMVDFWFGAVGGQCSQILGPLGGGSRTYCGVRGP